MASRARKFTFPKRFRLTRSNEFDEVKNRGRVQRGQLLLLSVLPKNDGTFFRAGFVTSRALGSAVVRNRVRRCLREIIRKHQHEISDSTWIVTIARVPAVQATYQQLEAEWLRLAKRASILSA